MQLTVPDTDEAVMVDAFELGAAAALASVAAAADSIPGQRR
jgi:hypothetical protein